MDAFMTFDKSKSPVTKADIELGEHEYWMV